MKPRIRSMLAELPGALALSFLTAAVTLILVLILSATVGEDSRRERAATRCYAAAAVNMLHDAFGVNPVYEGIHNRYPRINVDGLNCRAYLVSSPPPDQEPLLP